MDGSYVVKMGDRGRLVVPAELRARLGLVPGRILVLLETADGVELLTREQLMDRVRRDLAGHDLVAELLAERREASRLEDQESVDAVMPA